MPNRGRHHRRGSISLAFLISLVVILGLIALAIDSTWTTHSYGELQLSCDAAALAAAGELVDEHRLYPLAGEPATRDRLFAAAQTAQRVAAANPVAGAPLELELGTGRGNRDVTFGWLPTATMPELEMQTGPRADAFNSVIVHGELSQERGTELRLWFARVLGLPAVNVSAKSRATVDNQVYGFRHSLNHCVPLVPVAIAASADLPANFADPFEVRIPAGRGSTGVSDARLNQYRGAWFIETTTDEAIWRIVLDGLGAYELARWGGEIRLGTPVQPQPLLQLDTLQQALLSIRGQKRIWPLAEHSPVRARIQGFTAARIVDCRFADDDLVIVLAPCTLTTPTALIDPRAPRSASIGKIVLNRLSDSR